MKHLLFLLLVLIPSNALALEVVCTLPWLGDIAHRVAPDAKITTLARGADDPHFLSPTPALMAKVSSADLFVENGMGLELWSEKLLDSAGNPKIRPGQKGYVKATEGMNRLDIPTDLSRARGDLHPEGNPHVWLDPLNAPVAADNIAAGLARVDPAHAESYKANARAFRLKIHEAMFGKDLVGFMGGDLLTRLAQGGKLHDFLVAKKLDGRIGGWMKQGAALRGKPVVFYHTSWTYFVTRFGIRDIGYVEDRPGIAPTAAHRDELVALMKANGTSVVAVGNYYSDKIPRLLAKAAGWRMVTVPADIGGTDAAKDYFSLIDTIVRGLAK